MQGTFWFAAGVAFTSFALIDVSAVVAVEVGNGFMLTLLGLATAALPTPEFPLAQVQLALMAEFSTSAGVLEVLAQLTDQSYLLDPDCRLTGGFAYVSWFAPNPNAGQFVVTLGGYNPSFHHDGYPDVPRVGYRWCISDVLTISGQSYFALTSEAIMAGTNFTAALTLGPVWASLSLGVDAIVYFDPFKFSAHAYAAIAAGITFSVDLLFGTITISLSFHLGADVTVEGPSIHGSATVDLDVTSVTIAFGSSNDGTTPTLDWTTFANKYLTAKGDAQPQLSAAPTSGMLTPGASPAPDGSAAHPWLLLPEFGLSVATSAAATFASVSTNPNDPFPPAPGAPSVSAYQTTGTVAIAPMGIGAIDSYLGITITSSAPETLPTIVFAATPGPPLSVALTAAPMPKGVWAPQLPSGAIPTGDTITAGNGLTVSGRAQIAPGAPPVNYNQVDVEASERRQLPFAAEQSVRPLFTVDANNAATFFSSATTDPVTALSEARTFLMGGPFGQAADPFSAATFVRNRVAPPRLALLTEGLSPAQLAPPTLTTIAPITPVSIDSTIHPPVVTGLLRGGPAPTIRPVVRTSAPASPAAPTVPATSASAAARQQAPRPPAPRPQPPRRGTAPSPLRAPAPTLAIVAAALDPAFAARLTRSAPGPQPAATGLVTGDGGAASQRAGTPVEGLRQAGADPQTSALLVAQEQAMVGTGASLLARRRARDDPAQPRTRHRPASSEALSASGRGRGCPRRRHLWHRRSARGHHCLVGFGAGPVAHRPARRLVCRWDRFAGGGAGRMERNRPLALGRSGGNPGGRLRGHGFPRARPCLSLCRCRLGHGGISGRPGQRRRNSAAIRHDRGRGLGGRHCQRGLDPVFPGAVGGKPSNPDQWHTAPPTLVASGGRAHLVYDVAPTGSGPVIVSVGSGSAWRLAGVLGGPADAGTTADRLATGGAGNLVIPLVRAPTGLATVRWMAPTSHPAVTPPPGGRPS